ncbi:MAG: hypothetical protein CMD23_04600 [Flavobacteriales bacterium]|nr:hypothetical protein [Flavobacteriales bacterium]|tara:strand:- start:3202 stop:3927 length:726 start_codon:yes stop_codon:yes gene_type:complete
MAHHVLILAAGKGLRLESKTPKQFLEIHSLPIIMHSMQAFFSADPTSKIYVALSEDYIGKWSQLCLDYKFQINHEIYIGGNTRQESVFLGLNKIYNSFGESSKKHLVSIHDSARPFINDKFILELLATAKKLGNAVPFVKLKSALRKIDFSTVLNSVAQNREDYIMTQTPQIFNFETIYSSYKHVVDSSMTSIFDDSAVYDYLNNKTRINLVKGREYNIKITTKLDYIIAQTIHQSLKDLQ